jgi:hypothetical protein
VEITLVYLVAEAWDQVLGLSIDEAVIFWRRSFSSIQDDKFNKEYKYNIRHSYGLEGKRANYPARRSAAFSIINCYRLSEYL